VGTRKIVFYSCLFLFIIGINSGFFGTILDWLIGAAWSQSLTNILKQNSQGFVIIFAMCLYFDFAFKKSSAEISDDRIEITDGYFKNLIHLSPLKLLSRNLQIIYSDKSVGNLIDTVVGSKPIYKDVKVNFTLENHATDAMKYYLSYEIEFTADIVEYVIAVAAGQILQNQISNRCKKICDVLVLSSSEINYKDVLKGAGNIRFSRLAKDYVGKTNETPLILKQVPAKEYKNYLPEIAESYYGDVVLLRVKIEKKARGNNTYILLSPPVIQNKSAHYIYWVTDRPMWVRHIEFNTSNFTFNEKKDIYVQPLLINYYNTDTNINANKNKFVLNVHNWVANGQGALLSWG